MEERRVTPSQARIARSGEVLELVRRSSTTTTAEIAASMGVARSTVADRLDRLLDAGLIVADDARVLGRGRPVRPLRFNAIAGVVLVAQLGLSGSRVGVTDLDGSVLTSRTIDLDLADGPESVLPRIESEWRDALGRSGHASAAIFGIGLGVPGPVEFARVTRTIDHPWTDRPLADRLTATWSVPVVVDHDVNLLALAEHRANHRDAEVLLALKVGTALGCGVVVRGQVVRGGAGLAGEIGHTRVAGSDALCACGNRGCLAAVASGAAIVRILREQGVDVGSARDVARVAAAGDVPAAQAVRGAGREIGEVMAAAINLLNPDAIIVWGYLADAGDHLLAGMRERIYRSAVPGGSASVRLERASLGDDAGIRGAAATVIERILTPEAVDRLVTARGDDRASLAPTG